MNSNFLFLFRKCQRKQCEWKLKHSETEISMLQPSVSMTFLYLIPF
uniref:Uncharacterized protein n=1 Tax=Anguilla anguilla TaxID=7936 RepID=A0A0E9U557_ANGAN